MGPDTEYALIGLNDGHYAGVGWHKATNDWRARVTANGRTACAYFKNIDDAVTWRHNKVKEMHGDFARVQ